MTSLALLNGAHRAPPCPFAGRRAEETLHDFLLRRHQEMGSELALLHAQIEHQAEDLRAHRWTAHRRDEWLIAALAFDTTLVLMLFLAWVFGALPALAAGLAAIGLLGGNFIVFGMPALERGIKRLRVWRRQ